jgi:hypothetical protein
MKTAVDYIDSVLIDLIEKFDSKEYDIARNTLINFKNVVIEEAKEMFEEQIKSAFTKGDLFAEDYFYPEKPNVDCSENYYKETFKSE